MTKDYIVKNDLLREIRTFTNVDDLDYNETFFNQKFPGMTPWPKGEVKIEFSDWNRSQLTKYFMQVASNAKAILEIGVCRNDGKSSTWCFLNNKNPDTHYFGVDIEDKSFLDSEKDNVFTLRTSSSNTEEIMSFVKSKGIENIQVKAGKFETTKYVIDIDFVTFNVTPARGGSVELTVWYSNEYQRVIKQEVYSGAPMAKGVNGAMELVSFRAPR